MEAAEFDFLSYRTKLKELNQRGNIVHTFTSDGYQITVYSLNSFYVELRRRADKQRYDRIVATDQQQFADIQL